MRVFLLDGSGPRECSIVESFADRPASAPEDAEWDEIKALISTCTAYYKPASPGPRAEAEEAFAEQLGLAAVQYLLPR